MGTTPSSESPIARYAREVIDAIERLLDREKGSAFGAVGEAVSALEAAAEGAAQLDFRAGVLRRWEEIEPEIEPLRRVVGWLNSLESVDDTVTRQKKLADWDWDDLPHDVREAYAETYNSEPYDHYACFDWWHENERREAESVAESKRDVMRRRLAGLKVYIETSLSKANASLNEGQDPSRISLGEPTDNAQCQEVGDDCAPPLTRAQLDVLGTLVDCSPDLLLTVTEVCERMGPRQVRGDKTIRAALNVLIDRDFADRPQGPNHGVHATIKGRDYYRKIAD